MRNIKSIRERLGVTQQVLADGIGCTQGNIGHYECGQTMPPKVARRLIEFAKGRGFRITFDDIYGDEPLTEHCPTPCGARVEGEDAHA
ncbi:helix-turn-helix domain-containing protein [Variovorax sp. V116]|uniref:helix-turn-helix domain-containing protein n=1 Tax=Variovorax sp. V116 TaxID=3065953 RepID=UPI0034E8DD57